MVMLVEANSPNWVNQVSVTSPDGTLTDQRLGARHGQKSASGQQAYTNIAFFDGHVGLYPSMGLTIQNPKNSPYYPLAIPPTNELCFFLDYQNGTPQP